MEMANTFLSGNWRDKGPMKMKARKNPMEKCVTTLGAHVLPPICPSGQPVSCMNFPSNVFLFFVYPGPHGRNSLINIESP